MFPVTLEVKNLKAAMEGAKGERGKRRERTWLHCKMVK